MNALFGQVKCDWDTEVMRPSVRNILLVSSRHLGFQLSAGDI